MRNKNGGKQARNYLVSLNDIPERYWNRQIKKSIARSIFYHERESERLEREKMRYKNKIWQIQSNIIPSDFDERIANYLSSKHV